MPASLTKRAERCKALTLAFALACASATAAGGDRQALRNCIASAQSPEQMSLCERAQQERLQGLIARWSTAIRKHLGGEQLLLFERNSLAWKSFVDSELALLGHTLKRRRDGLGPSLYTGAVTRLYEQRERQLREHLHNLSYVGQGGATAR